MTNNTPNINFSFYKVSEHLPLIYLMESHDLMQEHF